jgi:phosphopantothenoylcysteine decarboxylase / phosphopantothenate---cysteine ligase
MARLLLGVSGGIAAYKSLELVRLATAAGHAVRVIQTPASLNFVGRPSFRALTGAPVLVDEWEADPARGAFPGEPSPVHEPASHLELVRRADALLIAPASANTLAKLAHGLADNLLTSAALAATCPLVLAPAMNNHMLAHPATRANLEALRARGATVLEPGEGRLATHGEWGTGRMPEPADLLAAFEAAVAAPGRGGPLDGLRVLVTAGGTREAIDSVRFVGNRSSGRMGWALADEAAARGAEVTVVAANVSLPRSEGIRYVDAASAAALKDACEEHFPACDVLLMAAAVADFRPAAAVGEKIRREGRERLSLELEPTDDVIAALAARRREGQVLVGFAAEHGDEAVEHARAKLDRKGLDAVVVNDVSRPDIGFDVQHNEVVVVSAAAETPVPRGTKEEVAAAVLDEVARLRGERPAVVR